MRLSTAFTKGVNDLRYAEIKNDADSYMIDDTYHNYRLNWMPSVKEQRCLTGLHVEHNSHGERVCTFPYYDYANGKTYVWRQGEFYPNPWCSKQTPNKVSWKSPTTYFGRPRDLWTTGTFYGFAGSGIQSMLAFEAPYLHARFSISKEKEVPYLFALGAAMPNNIYTFSTIFNWSAQKTNVHLINFWQRKTSLAQSLVYGMSFRGDNVGYTEFENYIPKNNENFQVITFTEEAETAPILYAYGLKNSKIALQKGEMIVQNERGEVIFNNRYDYMRVLKYFHSINALSFDGAGIYNSPKRFSFPGRRIAVAALSQNACYACGADRKEYLYNTGFWFPDPSTVEFTTCVSLLDRAADVTRYPDLSQSMVNLASLLNVMILDVTGCTPGWKEEAETGRPFLEEVK